MELNIINKNLRYFKNNKDLGIAFENIDFDKKEYHLAISMYSCKDSIKLTNFEQIVSNKK